MKRTVTVVAIVVVVALAGLLALPKLLVPSLAGAQIEQAVEGATGRTISFVGQPRLTLWPDVMLELDEVELSNPPGMFPGRLAAVDTLRLKVSLGALLRRKLEIEEIVAVRPRINLVVDEDGHGNFALAADDGLGDGETAEATQAGGSDVAAGLAPIVINDGDIKYLNERSGRAVALSNVDLTLSRSGPQTGLGIRGGFYWARQRVTVAVYVKSPARLTQDGSPSDITLTGPLFNAGFNGRAALQDGLELAGTLDFRTDSLPDLVAAAGLGAYTWPDLASFAAAGAVDISRHTAQFKDADFSLGPTNAEGDLTVSIEGSRPRIAGRLDIERVDLTADPAQASDEPDEAVADWSALPIKLTMLSALDAQLSLAVSELAYDTLAAGPSRFDVVLNNGRLGVTLDAMDLYGGTANGRITIDDSGQVPRFAATLEGRSIDAGRLAADLIGLDRLRGKTDVGLDLTAIGLSPRELVGRLEGSASLGISDGAITGLDVPALLTSLEGGVLKDVEDWMADDAATTFSTLAASFAIADGIAETDDLVLEGPAVRLSGAGSVDILRERLDLTVNPQVRLAATSRDDAGAFRGLPVPVVIDGFWSSPRIYPDIDGILDNPGKALKSLDLDLGSDKIEKVLNKADRLLGKVQQSLERQSDGPEARP